MTTGRMQWGAFIFGLAVGVIVGLVLLRIF